MLDYRLKPVDDAAGEVCGEPGREGRQKSGRDLKVVVRGVGRIRRIDADHQDRPRFLRAVGRAAMDGQRRARRYVAAPGQRLIARAS